MKLEKICIGCMREKDDGEACPYCGMKAEEYQAQPRELPPLTVLQGKYLLGKVLGSGGFGITYLALDLLLERTVAIKEFFLEGYMFRDTRQGPEIGIEHMTARQMRLYRLNKARFESEARSMGRLEHLDGIVKVYDYFDENLTSYLVMEYLSGVTLAKAVRRKTMTFHGALELLDGILLSLEELHRKGILHRDISPDNIMLLEDGSARLFDFGGVKLLDQESRERSEYVLMKGGFTPPEQLQSDTGQGPWTDVYAMSATIWFCISGRQPPRAGDRVCGSTQLQKIRSGRGRITGRQEAVLRRGMDLRPKYRYQSMKELEAALKMAEGRSLLFFRGRRIFRSKTQAAAVLLSGLLFATAVISFVRDRRSAGLAVQEAAAGQAVTAEEAAAVQAAPEEHAGTGFAEPEMRTPPTDAAICPEPGMYVIASALHEDMVLRHLQDPPEKGDRLVLWQYEGIPEQEWFYLEQTSEGPVRIMAGETKLSLDIRDGSDASGAMLQLARYVDAPGQQWSLLPAGNDTYCIVSALGTAIDLEGGSTENGAGVNMFSFHGGENQKWKLIRVG